MKKFDPGFDKSDLDPKVKRTWLRELRSGKRNQTSGYLCTVENNKESFCCIGVLADIALDTYWKPIFDCCDDDIDDDDNGTLEHTGYTLLDGSIQMLSPNYLSKIRLSLTDQDTLANMNDTQRLSFNEIADWIEKHL